MTPEEFYQALSQSHIDLTDKQKQQFRRYFNLLVEWNQKVNLTAITDENAVYLKHFYDSLAPILKGLISNEKIRLLDIGAGAGFPSIPMKIIYPNIDITIIDSLKKRITFLEELCQQLELTGVHLYHGRAEDFAKDSLFRGRFDVVTARAVARMQVLSELTVPFLKIGGEVIALKSSRIEEELKQAKEALTTLFCQVKETIDYALPNGDDRNLTVVIKKKETPNKYPRRSGLPQKKPL